MDGIPGSRFVTRKDFLDTLLPVDAHVLNAVYQRATDQLFDKERGQWAFFPPEEEGFERGNFNEPFVKIASYIATTAREMAQITPENEGVVCEAAWMDCLAQPPAYLDKDTAPDLSLPECALIMPVMVPLNDPSVPVDKTEKLWWMQLIAPVASRSYPSQTDESLVRQLLKYLRSIMAEQKDRRFVFGLTLSRSRVSVWLQDRSGAVGMDVPIDIHEDPKAFVHVITALAILPAHRLGFDTTLKLAREPLPPIHTYRLSCKGLDRFSTELYMKNNCEMQWVISMKNQTLMTVKALRDLHADAVVGASSMVWAAIRYEDRYLETDERTLFVVKQWWQSGEQADEGAIYEYLGDLSSTSSPPEPSSRYIGSMECHETVKIGGEVDSTNALIQRDLPTVPPPPDESPARTQIRRLNEAAASGWISFKADKEKLARFYAGEQVNPLRNRTRKRLVMNVFGCSIKYCASLRELLTLMLQGVREGHQYAYNNGVLQRDVSPSNLLITLLRTSNGSTTRPKDPECCLIDFGHASRIPNLSDCIVPPPEPTAEPLLPSMARELENITEALAQYAYHFIRFRAPESRSPKSLGVIYISAALDCYEKWNGPLPSNVSIEPGMFGWDDVPLLRRPVPLGLTEEQALRAPRVGNPPFASAQILNTAHVSVNRHFSGFRPNGVLHDATHDMESFFWTLLYFCITRSGPGGDRREELSGDIPVDSPNAEDVAELRRIVFCFFGDETETIAMNKAQLFGEPELFERGVLRHVHPYFEPLKPLLRQWWDLLLLAHEFEGYEYHGIHKFVIGLLEKALRELPSSESPEDMERSRRARERWDEFAREQQPIALLDVPRSPPSPSPVPTKKTKLV
ncbi:hypothetical protein EV714DRAFT_214004 [Schizophyllum commune]